MKTTLEHQIHHTEETQRYRSSLFQVKTLWLAGLQQRQSVPDFMMEGHHWSIGRRSQQTVSFVRDIVAWSSADSTAAAYSDFQRLLLF